MRAPARWIYSFCVAYARGGVVWFLMRLSGFRTCAFNAKDVSMIDLLDDNAFKVFVRIWACSLILLYGRRSLYGASAALSSDLEILGFGK